MSVDPELSNSERELVGGAAPSGLIPSVEGEFEAATHAEPKARSQWALFWRRFRKHKLAMASIVVLLVIIVLCFGAPLFTQFSNTHQDLLHERVSPNGIHWLGTDDLGRDEFTRLLYAGRISLEIGLAVGLLCTVVGTAVGAVAGYLGKATDTFLMRLTDLFLIVPGLAVLAIALKYFGQTDEVIILVLAGLAWMYVARVARGQVLALKEKEFVEAARASGASTPRIIVRHLIPNMIGPIMVNATLAVAAAIITESTLSYLGYGVQPPQSSWGEMLSGAEGKTGTPYAYLIYAPGLMILLTTLAVNFLGDGLRDAFDPQSGKH
jgi:peptide/nickel transport system permease protein